MFNRSGYFVVRRGLTSCRSADFRLTDLHEVPVWVPQEAADLGAPVMRGSEERGAPGAQCLKRSTTLVPPYSRNSSAPSTPIQKSRDRAGSLTTRMCVTAASSPSGLDGCCWLTVIPLSPAKVSDWATADRPRDGSGEVTPQAASCACSYFAVETSFLPADPVCLGVSLPASGHRTSEASRSFSSTQMSRALLSSCPFSTPCLAQVGSE